jgi:hypothetical protein
MRWPWQLPSDSYIELNFLADPAEQADFEKRALAEGSLILFFPVLVPTSLYVIFLLSNWLAEQVAETLSISLGWFQLIITFILLIITAYVFLYVEGRRVRSSLRKLLNSRGIPVCLGCGYDLRGLSEHRCPECGRPF